MSKLQPGDVILFKFDKRYWYARPWAALISWIIGSRYTHAAILIDTNHGGVIVEAYYPYVRRILLENSYYDNQYYWEAWRKTIIGEDKGKQIAKRALNYLTKPYDVKGLLSLAKEFILSGIFGYPIRRDRKLKNKNNKWFCSELVERCYNDAGIELNKGMPKGAMSPADFTKPGEFVKVASSID